MTDDVTGHAVVVGAGLSGLLTAHVLGRSFERVTVIERDALPDGPPVFRPGVPQSRHVHILWSRGMAAMEELLPGVITGLEAAGGAVVGAPEQMRWLSAARWFSGVRGADYLSVSRELLESALRRRVVADGSAVTVLDRHEVTGLLPARAGQTVGGVRLRERGADGAEFTMGAGLVVVAAGRSSRAAGWLSELGCPTPVTERVDARLGYSSRYFGRPADERPWKAMYVQGNPDVPRGGVILPVDGGRWLITLIGQGEHQPPTSEEDWLSFAASLRSAELSQALRGAVPLSDAVAFRATANEWTHFERVRRWPRGLMMVGDALCRFNPVYGHGMTVAALQAQVIAGRIAGREPADIAARTQQTQRAVAKCVRPAWVIATGEDRRYPGTDGPEPGRLGRMQQEYLARVLAAANTDPVVAEAFFAVLSLNRRPETLLTPRIAARALRRRR
ncbi:NAD(P)/FAD-dependent oxidoreductase [Streptomyces odonnellii]|uniref:NAD(P)/FAD-dependent oxidoreductase n=1 Tax=Streptomyces odonnellii TaxID=1417980 RepID=UPI000697A85E|nr:FAD-dependent monooxygenase [Streptomyces odonnellii]